ncbi:hypothetical protein ACFL1S_09490 [Pseudomonadota bacterium]
MQPIRCDDDGDMRFLAEAFGAMGRGKGCMDELRKFLAQRAKAPARRTIRAITV